MTNEIMKQETLARPIPRTPSRELINFSRIASFVLHPLFMTSGAAFIMYKLSPAASSISFQKWFRIIVLFTILLPFVSILIFKIAGLVSNARMHQPRDRILPLLATIFFYSAAFI